MLGRREMERPDLYVDGTDMSLLVELGVLYLDIMEKVVVMIVYVLLFFWFSILSFCLSLVLRIIFNYKKLNVYRPKMSAFTFWGISGGVALLSSVFSRDPIFMNYIGNLIIMAPIPLFYWLNIAKYKKLVEEINDILKEE